MRDERVSIVFVASVAVAVMLPLLGATGFFDPWETNYAEVAREMVVRDDYLYPYWKNAHFFSKPILLFWLTAPLYRLAGIADDGPMPASIELLGRLPAALLGIACVIAVYLVARRAWSRRAATLSALVLATSPYWAFLARQAITDMPYAAFMSLAVLALAPVIISDPHERTEQSTLPLPRWLVAVVWLCIVPQLWEIARTGAFLNRVSIVGSEHHTRLAIGVVACAAGSIAVWQLGKRARNPFFIMAAVCLALSTLAKGPVGAVLAVVIVAVTIALCDGVMGLVRFVMHKDIAIAVVVFFAIAAPWPLVMVFYDGLDEQRRTWFQRFVMYDLLGRVGAGVHGDRGGLEYYVRSLALGLVPWSGLVPVALLDGLRGLRDAPLSRGERLLALSTVWACGVFLFFSLATTKFHHYALPFCVPAALLVGHLLDGLVFATARARFVVFGLSTIVTAIAARELVQAPHEWIDLFTYHYKGYKPEYYFPAHTLDVIDVFGRSVSVFVLVPALVLGIAIALPLGFALWQRQTESVGGVLAEILDVKATAGRGVVTGAVCAGVLTAVMAVHVVMARASAHWSQRALVASYLSLRESGDSLVVYQMDWKGETFYSKNSEIQIAKNVSDLRLAVARPGREFIVVQSDRLEGLKAALGRPEGRLRVVDKSNAKWVLVVID